MKLSIVIVWPRQTTQSRTSSRDLEAASGAIARALSLNGSCATALYWGSHIHACSGDPGLAEDYAHRALRLSPFDPLSSEAHVALATVRFRQRRYDDAVACMAKAVQANPRFSVLYALQASALAQAGRVDEAKVAARRLLELEPTFHVQPFIEFAHSSSRRPARPSRAHSGKLACRNRSR